MAELVKKISGTICLYGAGTIAQCIGEALLKSGVIKKSRIWGVARSSKTAQTAARQLGIPIVRGDFGKRLRLSRTVILAVKPAQVKAALRQLVENGLLSKTLVISVATGVSLQSIQDELPDNTPVVRVVTNTPIRIREGMSALCYGAYVTKSNRRTAEGIFSMVGRCIAIEERHCEIMTALAGSGPAYFYTLMEALADGALKLGLPRKLAFEAVSQTMLGAAATVLSSGRHPAILRDEVTTPGGCTIGALLVMEEGKVRATLARAVVEATNIARRLGR